MPRLESAESLGGLPSARTGRGIARFDTSAIGEATARLGATVANAGLDLAAKWQATDDLQLQGRLQDFQFNEDKLYDEVTRAMQPGQARGFNQTYTAGYRERAKAFLAEVPDRLKPAYDQNLAEIEQRIYASSVEFERGEQRRSALVSLGDTVSNALLPRVEMAARLPEGDPEKKRILDQVQTDGLKLIDANPALSPIEKDEARRKLRTAVQSAFVVALSASERMNIGTQTVGERIVILEYGDGSVEKNPDSTATGPGQFIEETWLGVLSRNRPDLTEGKSKSEILALRTDEALSRQMVDALAAENSSYLTARGQLPTPGNIYLAHFLGADGAVAMLGADPELPAAMVNPKAAEANPTRFYNLDENGKPDFNSPRSVGDLIGWASASMDGTERVNWSEILDALPYETKVTIGADAAAEMIRMQTAERQRQQDQHAGSFNLLMNAIQDGSAGMTDIAAAYDSGQGWLTDYDERSKAIKAVEERDREGLTLAGVTARMEAGAAFNPYSTDDQKALDLYYEKGIMQGGANLLQGDANQIAQLRGFVGRTNYVPQAARDWLKMGMWSSDPQQSDIGFAVADNLYRENPAAFARAFNEADTKRLMDYQQYSLLPPDARAERLNPNIDPTRAKFRKEMEDEGREIAQKIDTNIILESFDPSWMPFNQPSTPIDGQATKALRADFETLFADRYAAYNGNRDAAANDALKLLRDRWGATEIGSGSYLMARPPERFFNPIDGGHDWMDEQLDAFVTKEFPSAQSWAPISMPFTEGAVGTGAQPSWAVAVVDKDGVFRSLLPPAGAAPGWPFDYETARRERLERFEQDRARAMEEPEIPVIPGLAPPSAIMERFQERLNP